MPTLIHCPTCRKDVSTDAKRCPHCGRNIDAYLKAENANASHYHEINKAHFKIILIIFVTILSIAAFVFFAIFCFLFRQNSIELHQICLDMFDYDGHYQKSANVWTALFVCALLGALGVGGFLIYTSLKVFKKQTQIIKREKALLLSEDCFR